MSEADEMFKELGYEIENNECYITYKISMSYKDIGEYYIRFYYEEKKFIKFLCIFETGKPSSITLQELQAINQKCKELGWYV